ncbi:MAG: efflux RND transporter periplasmic adaptor subunit [Isosphaeraceae bacterium]
MRRAPWPINTRRVAGIHWLLVGLLLAPTTTGCRRSEAKNKNEIAADPDPPAIRVIQPPVRDIVRVVDQPSFIEAYERTSVYPKLTAYIKEWKVDIGDRVKKDQVLATLFVPELEEDYETKKASVELAQRQIELAKEKVEVAEADVKAARARVVEAQAQLDRYQAEVERWDTEVKRLTEEVKKGVVDAKVLEESTHQWKSSIAARDGSKAVIRTAQAELMSKQATYSKAKVDVGVAEADLKVAQSEERRLKAWVGYLKLPAPFDGVIVARNANTFDFVLPSTGDPSANNRSPDLSPKRKAAPIYVVDRTDIVRIFVDVAEQDANYVQPGAKATVLVKAYRDQPIPASVTRTSWALNSKSRTLRAEIDLPNPGGQLLPGMYALAKVIIDRRGVRAVPMQALAYSGDRAFIWEDRDGHAVRTEIRTGVGDGEWIELTSRRVPTSNAADGGDGSWAPFDGSERVMLGDLASLTEGGTVRVAAETGGK